MHSTGYAAGSFAPSTEAIYGIIAGSVVALTLITCAFADDEPVQKSDAAKCEDLEDGAQSREKSFYSALSPKHFLTMPRAMSKAFTIQLFTYFAFMLLFVYGSNWVGKEVFRGQASAAIGSRAHKAYEHGIRVANRGFLAMALLSIVFAMILTPLCRKVGVQVVWSAGLLLLGACMVFTLLVPTDSAIGVYALFSCLSLPLAVTFTIPWTVASLALRQEFGEAAKFDLGVHMATFNASQALACLLAAILGGIFVRIMDGDMAKVLATGGLAAGVGSALVWKAVIPIG